MSTKKILGGLALTALTVAIAPTAIAQQTSGTIRGSVTDATGAPVADVDVKVTHVPTGTVQAGSTNAQGIFVEAGLRPGGPYTVEVSGPGIQPQRVEDVYVSLSDPFAVNIIVEKAGATNEAVVVVTAKKLKNSGVLNTGAGSKFGQKDLADVASINRDLKDVFKKDPLVSIDPTNGNAVSFAGQNSRFNQITIDGVKQSDDFGLNANGYPTQRSPISIDAINVLEARVAPYAVTYDGFFGGNVNIVTKSGSNEFHGDAFYEYNDQGLRGTRVKDRTLSFIFDEKTYGASLGGPIIKDKLFFFANYEKFEGSLPISTGPIGSGLANITPGITTQMVDQIRADAKAKYNFDPGGLPSAVALEDEKFLAKIDWNITDRHRASFSYQYTNGNSFNGGGGIQNASTSSTQPRVSLLSNQYDKGEKLVQYGAQLTSNWTDKLTTEVRVSSKNTETTQIPFGGLGVGQIDVNVGGLNVAGDGIGDAVGQPTTPSGARITFGADVSRHDNYLNIDTLTWDARATYQLGRHTLTGGVGMDSYDFQNVFVQRSFGNYTFNSYANFLAGKPDALSLQGAVTPAAVAAGVPVPATFGTARLGQSLFSYNVFNAYAQDTYELNDALTLQYGLRYVRYSTSDKPLQNKAFESRYPGSGLTNTNMLDGKDAFLPRFGFTYDVNDSLRFSGGVGKFTGGTLNVWVSNNFSQNGVNIVNATCPSPLGTITNFTTAPAGCTFTPGNGNVNLIDPNFEIPTTWKSNLSAEWYTLEDKSLRLFGDVVLSQVDQAINYRDLRLVPKKDVNGNVIKAPDGRPIYTTSTTGTTAGNQFDLELTNTDQGDSQAITVGFEKTWENLGLDLNMSYTHTDANEVSPATSSVALSNYSNVATSDPNNLTLATSDYEVENEFKMSLTWEKEIFGDNKTTVALYGDHRSGLPFSYTFNGSTVGGLDTVFGYRNGTGTGFSNALFYVPKASEVAEGAANATASTKVILNGITAADFDAYLTQQGLDGYRGQITPRNEFTTKDWAKFDLHVAQEFPAFFPNSAKFIGYMDIENLGNLINKNWGVLEQESFPRQREVVNVAIDSSGRYVYSNLIKNPAPNLFANESTYRIKFGIRYQF